MSNSPSDIPKPNFIIIGSAKCGTTTLSEILSSHPDCCFSQPKEVEFFQDTLNHQVNPNYAKGWDWYKQSFNHYQGEKAIGEATPSYSRRTANPKTAERIYQFNPEMRIIYMVRHPIKRFISAWKMHYAAHLTVPQNSEYWKVEHDWASRGFEFWLLKAEHSKDLLDSARFNYQLDAYRNFFPEHQILVSFLEDWKHGQEKEVSRICKFLDLDPTKVKIERAEGWNKASDRTTEQAWLKNVRQHPVFPFLRGLMPQSMRYSVGQMFGKRKLEIPEPTLTADTKAFLRNYLANDAVDLLKSYAKPVDFWKF